MKALFIISFFVIFAGCIAPTTNYNTTQKKTYEIDPGAFKPNRTQDFLDDLASSTRAYLEARAAARKAHQQRNAVIRENMKKLPPPDKVFTQNEHHIYRWNNTHIGVVIKNLGTPDSIRDIGDGWTTYRWGSYVFCENTNIVEFKGVICIEVKRAAAKQSKGSISPSFVLVCIGVLLILIAAANS